MWVRGLKQRLHGEYDEQDRSHPVWVRGLKLTSQYDSITASPVAPRVGAWIETNSKTSADYYGVVAPRVGAWIETLRVWTFA